MDHLIHVIIKVEHIIPKKGCWCKIMKVKKISILFMGFVFLFSTMNAPRRKYLLYP